MTCREFTLQMRAHKRSCGLVSGGPIGRFVCHRCGREWEVDMESSLEPWEAEEILSAIAGFKRDDVFENPENSR